MNFAPSAILGLAIAAEANIAGPVTRPPRPLSPRPRLTRLGPVRHRRRRIDRAAFEATAPLDIVTAIC